MVAVGVALVSTLAGSVFDRVHQVDAEALVRDTVAARPAGDQQTLVVPEWGVQATIPLAAEMPLLSYSAHGQSSIGLSSAGLVSYGPLCSAARNALGVLVRYPLGGFDQRSEGAVMQYFLAQVGQFEYAYQLPQTSCLQADPHRPLINQQTSVLREALGTLSAIQP
jgi:hypothetical protein